MSVISLYLPEFYCQFGCSVYVWSDCPNIMNLVIIGSFVSLLDAMYSASSYSLWFVLSRRKYQNVSGEFYAGM
jgi:hypothetical protein